MTRAMLIFDGDCGFCTTVAQWAERGWRTTAEKQPWQTLGSLRLAEFGLTTDQAQAMVWWVDPAGHPVGGHRAIAEALKEGTGWRRVLGSMILLPPAVWLAPIAYRTVSRNRHRLPGGTPACRLGE
jgi:predicted DCC family thiol-disulfide oxidoreductase YuxK